MKESEFYKQLRDDCNAFIDILENPDVGETFNYCSEYMGKYKLEIKIERFTELEDDDTITDTMGDKPSDYERSLRRPADDVITTRFSEHRNNQRSGQPTTDTTTCEQTQLSPDEKQ